MTRRMEKNNRSEQRFNCGDLEIIVDDALLAQCGDISKSGAFIIITSGEFHVGPEISLLIPSYDLSTRAKVRYILPNVGVGIEFAPQSSSETDKINSIIDNMLSSVRDVQFKIQVILIDEDGPFRAELRRILQRGGFSVTEASEAMVAVWKMSAFPINAVILSLDMKGKIAPPQLIKIIRESPSHAHTPVLAYARKDTGEAFEQAFQSGANQCLSLEAATGEDVSSHLRSILKMGADPSHGKLFY